MLELYEIICICALVITLFTVTAPLCRRIGVRPFALAFPAIAVLLLKDFDLRLFPELHLNAAVVFLPVFFAGHCTIKEYRKSSGSMYMLFVGALIPIIY